jgi:hypothetical protein
MKNSRTKLILMALVAGLLLALWCAPAFSQCAMCRAAASGGALGRNPNTAIMVLLIPPVVLFCAIFIVAYRYRMAPGEAFVGNKKEKTQRTWLKRQEKSNRGENAESVPPAVAGVYGHDYDPPATAGGTD